MLPEDGFDWLPEQRCDFEGERKRRVVFSVLDCVPAWREIRKRFEVGSAQLPLSSQLLTWLDPSRFQKGQHLLTFVR
jgi:hypothetical protein